MNGLIKDFLYLVKELSNCLFLMLLCVGATCSVRLKIQVKANAVPQEIIFPP